MKMATNIVKKEFAILDYVWSDLSNVYNSDQFCPVVSEYFQPTLS
jgi:hypothetical protein